jgi:pilus assembly protein Flp/PilA
MRTFSQAVVRFFKDENGPTTVEYAIMMALVFLACFATIAVVGKESKPAPNKAHAKRYRGLGS